MDSSKLKILWRNLSLQDNKTGTNILNELDGSVQSGTFLSIMGPSGAGKSSLLALLTARMRKHNTSLNIYGEILLNGQPYSLNHFSKISAYVQQDDLLFGTLTVKETFEFQGKLKLWNISESERAKKCQQLLKKLNLIECANTLVGNGQFKKSISGGQKKRVAIGVELLSNPSILIFDQPTSGLDSHNALVIVKLLSELARNENKLIITTIHQPSTLIFQQMDQLYLLGKGQCIYNGPAKNIVSYMQKIGIQINYRMNPADFFMLQISQLKSSKGYNTPLNSSNYKKNFTVEKKNYDDSNLISQFKQSIEQVSETPLIQQFQPLFIRSFKNFIRTPSNQINKLVTGVMIPAFLGLLYMGLGDQAPQQFSETYILKLMAFLFMGCFFVFSMNIYDTTLVFPTQKQLVFKQTGSNLYSVVVYFITRLLTQILGSVLPAVSCAVIIYFCVCLDLAFNHFIVFVAIFVIMGLQGYFFGLMFGVLCKNTATGITLLPLIVIPILIFGGLIIKISDIPQYIRWLQYFSSLRHAFLILFQDVMASDKFIQYSNIPVAQLYGVGGDSWQAFYFLMGLLCIYFLASIILLKILQRRI